MSIQSKLGPSFLDGSPSLVIVLDQLAGTKSVWDWLIPERLCSKLSEGGATPSMQAIGDTDTLLSAALLAKHNPGLSAMITDCLDELELRWSLTTPLQPRPGLREILRHLENSKVEVVFVTSMSELAGQRVVQASLPDFRSYQVFGRRSLGPLATTYTTALGAAQTALQSKTVPVLLHANLQKYFSVTQAAPWITIGSRRHSPTGPHQLDLLDLAETCALTAGEQRDVRRRVVRRDRLDQLMMLPGLTDEQMQEYARLTGGVRMSGNLHASGHVDEAIGAANIQLLPQIRIEAARNGFLLEVVSIDAALLEVELRNWLIVHRSHVFKPNDRKTFGQTIRQAEDGGLAPHLIKRLRAFNDLRNEAVHHLGRGTRHYLDIGTEYMRDCILLRDVQDAVYAAAPVLWRADDDD